MANENDNLDGPKTKPLRKTSAVPLRKETVRVTLKATPGGTAGAPGSAPAPAPPRPPSVATAPLDGPVTSTIEEAKPKSNNKGNPNNLPEITSAIPLRQETMRVTLKADNSGMPMAPAPSSKTSTGAPAAPAPPSAPSRAETPTVPLGGGVPAVPSPPTSTPTVPISTPAEPTQEIGVSSTKQPLPTATVPIQQNTQPMGNTMGTVAPMPAAHTSWEDEVNKGEKAALVLSAVALFAALIAVGTQVYHSNHWVKEHKEGDLMSIFSTKQIKFEKKKLASDYITINK